MRKLAGRRPTLVSRIALVLVVALAGAASAAEEKPQASGKIESRNWNLEIRGAYAYPGEVGFDDQDGIRVAVSNSGFAPEKLDRYWDRGDVISKRMVSDEVLVATFQFDKAGGYQGLSYYFGSGDGCGYCYDGSVQSTVKVKNGRIAGKLTAPKKEGEIYFELEFDVPVASGDYGAALPAGFGEPAKVYAEFHRLLDAGEASGLASVLFAEEAAQLATNGDTILSSYLENHPSKSYKIVKGWSRGDRALLLVEGETSYSNVKTEVHLVLENKVWRIYDEILQMRYAD